MYTGHKKQTFFESLFDQKSLFDQNRSLFDPLGQEISPESHTQEVGIAGVAKIVSI